ncbi:hypothetical protein Tgr7_0520 [Thioalkalivibrio sulfidiphilus HL-EbGr7]|uniref:Uncharacterized protein n=1 Tax=Thioalkalivibrio sulfidiphilus (strain HL-EbGR7) TaxID=396588 RepID=B8GL99_THISH|nr:hypothetical protein [Thioalkalivibrio sulfidiphilus]ACL71617.1 hypothetical protein Tgr7_0520 [Thioalkalivibrio sulfidiphilus HL-EbGr7]
MDSDEEFIRHRELAFRGPHRDNDQARAACLLLSDTDAVQEVRVLGPNRLVVTYDLRQVTYSELESALTEMGFHLDNSLVIKIKRALYNYSEDTIRANLGIPSQCFGNCARKIFINHYRQHEHGCRDHRPRHWREYL